MTLLEAAYYRDTCVKYARHIRQEPANFPHNTRMFQSELESNCLTGSSGKIPIKDDRESEYPAKQQVSCPGTHWNDIRRKNDGGFF